MVLVCLLHTVAGSTHVWNYTSPLGEERSSHPLCFCRSGTSILYPWALQLVSIDTEQCCFFPMNHTMTFYYKPPQAPENSHMLPNMQLRCQDSLHLCFPHPLGRQCVVLQAVSSHQGSADTCIASASPSHSLHQTSKEALSFSHLRCRGSVCCVPQPFMPAQLLFGSTGKAILGS